MKSTMRHSNRKELWRKKEQALCPSDLVTQIGRIFLGAPYRTGTLETAGAEKLVINLAEFDCTTFVETVLALAGCAVSGDISRLTFRKNLQFLRYRQGKINGYASRLHYFSDWLRENEKKKILKDVSRSLNGRPALKKINFMTHHRELYAGFKKKSAFEAMRQIERNLSRKVFYTIGSDKINHRQTGISEGDVIAFTTDQAGLDVAHVGFAVRQGRHVHLLHASGKEGAVVISKETLPAYLKSNKKFTGVMVARLL